MLNIQRLILAATLLTAVAPAADRVSTLSFSQPVGAIEDSLIPPVAPPGHRVSEWAGPMAMDAKGDL